MKLKQRLTILGCGSSPGVPRIDGDWGACNPGNPKNRRRRASLLIEQFADNGGCTTVVIDTGPDFREQMIDAGVKQLDAAIYSHPHADHIHGIDDLRGFALVQRRRMPIYADANTMERLKQGFAYCFETPAGSSYPPIVDPVLLESKDEPLVIEGEGGPVSLTLFDQIHGGIMSLGFRIGRVAYCCDVSGFPGTALDHLADLDCLIVDALQYREHPSHLSLSQALAWIDRLKPSRAVLTHMHIPLDYETVRLETPDHVEPAHDMMQIEQFVDVEYTG